MSQSVALMKDGKFEQVATPEDLYRRPASSFVAGFIGAGTLLSADAAVGTGDRIRVRIGSREFEPLNKGVSGAGPVEVLLRPEEVVLDGPTENAIDGEVESCAFLGSHYEAKVTTAVGSIAVQTARQVAPGAIVGLSWPDDAGIAYPVTV